MIQFHLSVLSIKALLSNLMAKLTHTTFNIYIESHNASAMYKTQLLLLIMVNN
jgi:hypothetical protein